MRRPALFAATLLLAGPMLAQEPPPPIVQVAPVETPGEKEPAPEKSLADLMPEVRWPRTRGPLLLVAPERLELPADVLASARSREGLSLTTLAPLVKHKIERYGNLSVLGPLTMPITGMPPGMMEMIRRMPRPGSVLPLLAALNEAQWTRVTSDAGLGRADLTSDRQRELWENMIPSVALFSDAPISREEAQKSSPRLTQAQRLALRLRVSKRLELLIAGVLPLSRRNITPEDYDLAVTLDPNLSSDEEQQSAMIAKLLQEVPYQRKKTDLDPALLDAPVALTGAKTVGELVQRIAKATGIEIYADRRLGALAIAAFAEPDQSVRAGDALSALVRATATTVRSVAAGNESAFVLTFDRIPLAVSSLAANDEMMPIFLRMAQSARYSGQFPDIWKSLPRRGQTELAESLWQAGEGDEPTPIPFDKLPAPLAELAEKLRGTLTGGEDGADGRPVRSVTPRVKASIELIAPFWGSATALITEINADLFGPSTALPAASLPTAKTRALQVALPRTEVERGRLLALASERGFTMLLVPLSGDLKDDGFFALLAKEAQAKKLSAVPTLCPLQPSPDDTSLERDLSLTGRSATEMNAGRTLGLLTEVMPPLAPFFSRITERDFVSPEAAPISAFARRVAALAALPGVTDIVLAELAAPGYDNQMQASEDFLWTGGATPSARLASLRRDSFDPADISVNLMMGSSGPPLFEGSEPQQLWAKACLARRDVYLKRLDTALKATGQKARLWAAPLLQTSNPNGSGYLSPWQGKLPAAKTPMSLRLYEHLSATMESVNNAMSGQGRVEEPNLTIRWLGKLFKERKTESFILDFTDLSLKDTLLLLEASVTKKPAGP